MKKLLPILIVLLLLGYWFFFRSSEAQRQARKFCSCSVEMAKAEQAKREGSIELIDYQRIREEQIRCMGTEDPKSHLSPEEQLEFMREFLKEVQKRCPETGRMFGYDI